jgi:hypothetical protein
VGARVLVGVVRGLTSELEKRRGGGGGGRKRKESGAEKPHGTHTSASVATMSEICMFRAQSGSMRSSLVASSTCAAATAAAISRRRTGA